MVGCCPIRYRLHWRERHGVARIIRWLDVEGSREESQAAATDAAGISLDGTVRIMAFDEDGRAARAVACGPAEIAAWRPERQLPKAGPSEWTRRVSVRHARVANVARLRTLLGRFERAGLLDARQTDGIAREVCLALDGLGGFGLPGGEAGFG